MAWKLHLKVEDAIANEVTAKMKGVAKVLRLETARLIVQICPYCDGFGHSGNDCPTDHKIAHLRGGVREQSQLLMRIRKELRAESNMGNVTHFSLLSSK